MRSVRLALLLALPLALPLHADEVVLKDGRSITTKGPYKVKGRTAVMTAADGTLVSIPVSEIDLEKTAEAQARAAAPEPPSASPTPKPLTPAEAARMKAERKATVVLTDSDVSHPLETTEGGAKESVEDGKVEVSQQKVTAKEGGFEGFAVTGILENTGQTEVLGLTINVEAVGQNNKTLLSVFGNVPKDTLAPGEKTSFVADLKVSERPTVFRYFPRWKVKVKPTPAEGTPAAPEKTAGTEEATPTPAPTPPPPPPTPRPTQPAPVKPGFAAPAASGPVGQPDPAGGTYLPVPSDGQPKQPQ